MSSVCLTGTLCLSLVPWSQVWTWVIGLAALQHCFQTCCFQTSCPCPSAEPWAFLRSMPTSDVTLPPSVFLPTVPRLASSWVLSPRDSTATASSTCLFKSLDHVWVLRNLSVQLVKDLSVPHQNTDGFRHSVLGPVPWVTHSRDRHGATSWEESPPRESPGTVLVKVYCFSP